MAAHHASIDGLAVFRLPSFPDARGQVTEVFRESRYRDDLHVSRSWRQVNCTESRPGTIRGLHGEAMTKLVSVVAGECFGVYVDTRPDSPSFGAVDTVDLRPGVQVLVPSGVCNGFQSIGTTNSLYLYLFDAEWSPGMAGVSVNPTDPELGISWPIDLDRSVVSNKDGSLPALRQVLEQRSRR